jgi:DNA-binding transcriptional LysR family regulator
VRIGHLPDSSLVARAVGDMRRMVVASPDYLATHGEPRHPSEIVAHRIVHFGALSAGSDWRFVEDGHEIRVPCAPGFTTNSADAAIFHAEQGGGLTRVLAYQAAEGLASGRLKTVLTDYEIVPLPIHLVYPTSRLLSAKVRAFVDLVLRDCDWHFARR